jgi:hypothetical protein
MEWAFKDACMQSQMLIFKTICFQYDTWHHSNFPNKPELNFCHRIAMGLLYQSFFCNICFCIVLRDCTVSYKMNTCTRFSNGMHCQRTPSGWFSNGLPWNVFCDMGKSLDTVIFSERSVLNTNLLTVKSHIYCVSPAKRAIDTIAILHIHKRNQIVKTAYDEIHPENCIPKSVMR